MDKIDFFFFFLQLLWDASCASSDVITFASGMTPDTKTMRPRDEMNRWFPYMLLDISVRSLPPRWMKTSFCCCCFPNECEGSYVGYLVWRNAPLIILAINTQKSMIVLSWCQYVPSPLEKFHFFCLFASMCGSLSAYVINAAFRSCTTAIDGNKFPMRIKIIYCLLFHTVITSFQASA